MKKSDNGKVNHGQLTPDAKKIKNNNKMQFGHQNMHGASS